ncbi:MAG TPA: LysR family transcriptional regulator [Candidatus Binatia bacterium]
MTLHQLRVFAKVAELQSFTAAARALALTQPSVSSLIQGLVDELGHELFERRGIKIALTPEGTVFYRRTKEALGIIDGADDEIAELRGLRKGRLSVGGSAIAGASFLPGAIQAFKQNYPGIEVVLAIHRSDALEKKLIEGEFDVAVLGWEPRAPVLRGTLFGYEEIVVIAPANHPLNKQSSVGLKVLSKEPLIIQQKGNLVRDMVEERFSAKRLPFVPVLEVDVQVGGWETIKTAVASGLGIGFFSKCHVEWDVKAGRVKLLRVPELALKRPIYIALHKDRRESALVRTFANFLKAYKER